MIKRMNWVTSNTNDEGKYEKPYSWCGEDMFIDFDVTSPLANKNHYLMGNFFRAYCGKKDKPKYVKNIFQNFDITDIKYIKDNKIYYKNVDDDKGVTRDVDTFNCCINCTLTKEVKLEDSLTIKILLIIELNSGEFKIKVSNVCENDKNDIKICGIRLNLSFLEDDNETGYSTTIMNRDLGNYAIIKRNNCDKTYDETMIIEKQIDNIETFYDSIVGIEIIFKDPIDNFVRNFNDFSVYSREDQLNNNNRIKEYDINYLNGPISIIRLVIIGNNLESIENVNLIRK